jgi:glycosyltransferase involved in cell wall biosynthesis
MITPRVTIGLPVYNGEAYLQAALDSILAQDFTDFELLIGDNGSTDKTPKIAQAAAALDKRVVVHRCPNNRGAAWNYNRLVKLARGEYFKWAAHDDLLKPQFLRRCIDILDTDPEVVLCYSQVTDIDEAGRAIHHWDMPIFATEGRPAQRIWGVMFRQPAKYFDCFGLMRRDVLLKTHCIGNYTGSDTTLMFEMALLGRFYEIPVRLFLHREHSGRSMNAYADAHARNIWFDPKREGRLTAPQWRLLVEYGRAIARSPIPLPERFRASKALRWWIRENRKKLRRDLIEIRTGQARAALLANAGGVKRGVK